LGLAAATLSLLAASSSIMKGNKPMVWIDNSIRGKANRVIKADVERARDAGTNHLAPSDLKALLQAAVDHWVDNPPAKAN
jgi:hypothetical protein